MADFHRLLYPHSLLPGASLPFHVSPHLSFSTVRFSPPYRASCPPIFFCRPGSLSTSPSPSLPSPTEIVSSKECPDGSFLFKFGDPSEIEKDASDSGGSNLGEDHGLAEDDETGSISNAVDKEKNALGLTALRRSSSELNKHSGTGSAVEKKETSTSMAENGTNFHEESVGIKMDDPNTLPEAVVDIQTNSPSQEGASGKINQNAAPESGVVDIQTSRPSEDEASQEIDHGDAMTSQACDDLTSSLESGTVTGFDVSDLSDEEAPVQVADDDAMASKVSLQLQMSSEGCSSSKLKISSGTSLDGDPDSLVHETSGVDDDYVIEIMPKNVKVEAGINFGEEVANNVPSDLSAAESFQYPVLADDGACLTDLSVVQSDSIGNNEVSDCTVGAEQADTTVLREEISIPSLALASGVASLTCPSQELAGAEDAYVVVEEKWFIVANIVAEWSLEGMKAGLYGHKLLENCRKLILERGTCDVNVREVLEQSAANVHYPGLLSVLIAHFHNEVLHVANIGDTRFIVVRNGFVHKNSSPHFHEFNFPVQIRRSDDPLEVAKEYEVNLDDGDVIVMATDGLFDNLYQKDIASIVSKSLEAKMKPEEIAGLLAMRAQEVGRSTSTRSPFSDEAQAAGYAGYSGGKLDHVTVIVSFVKKQSSP